MLFTSMSIGQIYRDNRSKDSQTKIETNKKQSNVLSNELNSQNFERTIRLLL